MKTKARSGAPETNLSHFPTESDAFKFTFDGQRCTTGSVVQLTDTSNGGMKKRKINVRGGGGIST